MSGIFDVSGKTAIVTGGNVGIGLSIARRFLECGMRVVTCSRRDYDRPPAAEGLDAEGRIVHMACDVREVEQIDAVVSRTLKEFGSLDVLVNNAGGSPAAVTATTSPRFFSSVIAINLVSMIVFSQRANAVMQEQDRGGVIVNIASIAGLQPSPMMVAYGAAKAGVINATRSLAAEWGPKVRVNCIAPGLILTEGAEFLVPTDEAKRAFSGMNPSGRIGLPDDVAGVCQFLVSDASSYVNGDTIVIDGGGRIRAGF